MLTRTALAGIAATFAILSLILQPAGASPPSARPPLLGAFFVSDIGSRGTPRLTHDDLHRISAVRSVTPHGLRSRLMGAFVANHRTLVLFYLPQRLANPTNATAVPILGACNLYYHAGAVFAGPGGSEECLHWTPTAADIAAGPFRAGR